MKWVSRYQDLPEGIRKALLDANVFYTEAYHRYRTASGKVMGFLFDSQFIIPALLTHRPGFVYADYVSEPFCLQGSYSPEAEALFLDHATDSLAQDHGVMWIRQTPVTALFQAAPSGAQQIPFGSYVIDLRKTEEEIWSGFTSKYRQYGRQFREAGGTTQVGGSEQIPMFYDLLTASMSRAEAGIEPIDYYRTMASSLPENCKIFIAFRDQKPEAAVQILFNLRMSYTLYGGMAAHCHRGSNIMMYWEAIRHLKSLGVQAFSFVGCRINVDKGSKYEGIQTFKERFGGELRKGVMFKVTRNTRRAHLFNAVQRLRLLAKGTRFQGDVIDQEIHKWSSAPTSGAV